MGTLPIPKVLSPYFGLVPSKILDIYTLESKIVDGRSILAQVLATIFHRSRSQGWLLPNLQDYTMNEYIVVNFDYTCCEVMTKCPDHADATRRTVEQIVEGGRHLVASC
jgi:hypothetical protein